MDKTVPSQGCSEAEAHGTTVETSPGQTKGFVAPVSCRMCFKPSRDEMRTEVPRDGDPLVSAEVHEWHEPRCRSV